MYNWNGDNILWDKNTFIEWFNQSKDDRINQLKDTLFVEYLEFENNQFWLNPVQYIINESKHRKKSYKSFFTQLVDLWSLTWYRNKMTKMVETIAWLTQQFKSTHWDDRERKRERENRSTTQWLSDEIREFIAK